jgi:hypothetical protein
MIEGFQMDLATAEEFFIRCLTRKSDTEAERIEILKELVAELRAVKLNEKDLKRRVRGKKVLGIGFKKES